MTNPTPPLLADIIPMIADHLLVDDLIDLISFRAACRHFRSFSPNARSLAYLHRPRHWIMLSDGNRRRDLSVCRSFLNLSSSRTLQISLPDLHDHHILSSVEGLLILLHWKTLIVRILNPFNRLLADLPPLSHKVISNYYIMSRCSHPPLFSVAISSSENPTIVISSEKSHHVLLSKPGDKQWMKFDQWHDFQYNLSFFQGRFYSTNQQGTICSINLQQEREELMSPDWEPGRDRVYQSYLVVSNSTLLLVRKYTFSRPNGALIEVYEVNPKNKTVSLVNYIKNCALFVGPTRTLSVSSKDFPCIKGNSIYLGTDLLQGPVVIYNLENHFCEPISDKTVIHNGVSKLRPSVRPFTLADHLITYCSHIQWVKGLMYHEFCVFPRGWS